MLTVVSIIVGVSGVSIATMWIYDMQQSGAIVSSTAALSEVWFLTFVYELTAKGILSDLWATLVYALVFLSGFLSLVSNNTARVYVHLMFTLRVYLFIISRRYMTMSTLWPRIVNVCTQ
jgi:hypothetical protein